MKNYRFSPPAKLPPADDQGIRTYKERQFVDLAIGGVVQVRRDSVTGVYRAILASELGASGPALFFDRGTMTWLLAAPLPSSGVSHVIDIDVDEIIHNVRNGQDSDGLIDEGQNDRFERNLSPGSTIVARGLRQFSPEQAALMHSELKAVERIFFDANNAVGLNYREAEGVFESYFGGSHEVAIDRFSDSLLRGQALSKEYQGLWGVDKFMGVDSGGSCKAWIYTLDFHGRIFISLKHMRDGTLDIMLGHEMLHANRINRFTSVGPGAVDFFYLDVSMQHTLGRPIPAYDIPERGLSHIIMQGGLTAEYLSAFTSNHHRFIHGVSEYLGIPADFDLQTAVNLFNANPGLRAQMASRNADSIIWAAKSMQQLHQSSIAEYQWLDSLIDD
ncbi:hypothetical protein [Pseudomonas fluorescens]|uniref:hypothetical protein n=1 Tax=Pseudomonas fluorescens TaxID=294 RepID=UPI001CD4CA56|nr:hypothetical protein [Pseudomonas fluorescens]